jgi:hypothetical protein
MIPPILPILPILLSLHVGRAPCINVALEPDPYDLGGHRYDTPEHIRGLHARGDSAGSPVRVGGRSFYLWALDTELDGVERYDRIATSVSDDVASVPEHLISLRPRVTERISAMPAGLHEIAVVVPALNAGLERLVVCVDPDG